MMIIRKRLFHLIQLIILIFIQATAFSQSNPETWHILAGSELSKDEAFKLVVGDLTEACAEVNISLQLVSDQERIRENSIIVGNPETNRLVRMLESKKKIVLKGMDHPQGCEIITVVEKGKRIIIASGGSVIGDVYGLYWIWDRIRVNKKIPDINTIRIPALETRINLTWGRGAFGGGSEDAMHKALRYGMNWVAGTPLLDIVPWDSEPENTVNAENRRKARELIAYAHKLHMKYYSFANEFTYHPSLLASASATLSACDPAFWDMLQEKYRKLFAALPELDGIEVCNDDISGFWEDYQPFDVLHEVDTCNMPYELRFRTFVKKLHEVVVGQFDKTYFHFTWGLVAHEQHYSAEVFRKIFTEEIPQEHLFFIPKITAADRWWHQPYNPTFNQSPHSTLVGFETMNYYEGSKSNIFPTFAGQYYQAGLQSFLEPENSNVRGAGFLTQPRQFGWDTHSAYSYVLYRLAWNPDDNMEQIARDFCAINFGTKASNAMAKIYLLSPKAYKYGLHIEPISYGRFNSFIHMRVNTFPAMGYPSIDGGKEHLDFLKSIYYRCKPWEEETLEDLDHGLLTAEEMCARYQEAKHLIDDNELSKTIGERLEMTRLLIKSNNLYVKTMFHYFRYIETPTAENREQLAVVSSQLEQTIQTFRSQPGFGYKLFGLDQLMINVAEALTDLEGSQKKISMAPGNAEIEKTITDQQQIYKDLLKKHKHEAVKLFHFEGAVDGRDILSIRDSAFTIEHLRWDPAFVEKAQFSAVLPQVEVTVLPEDLESRPMHPFILEQPCKENDYTVKIYLYDKPGGHGKIRFNLYYIAENPETLGLKIPWNLNE